MLRLAAVTLRALALLALVEGCSPAGVSLYLGHWNEAQVALSVHCAPPTGSFQSPLAGALTLASGQGVDLQSTDTGGCVFQWNLVSGTAILQDTPVCTFTFADPSSQQQISVTATWAGTLETQDGSNMAVHLDGQVSSISESGAALACPSGSAAVDGTLTKG